MKYIVMNMNGDVYNDEFDNEKEAIQRAEYRWNHLTKSEKKRDDLIVLVSNDPDEDSQYHFDGNPIWKNGEEIPNVEDIPERESREIDMELESIFDEIHPNKYWKEVK